MYLTVQIPTSRDNAPRVRPHPSTVVNSLTLNIFRAGQDTVLPVSEPIHCTDGTTVHEVAVPKGTAIVLGIQSCNRNKALWGEDAEEWKPERWLALLPATLTNAKLPGVYSNLRVAFYHYSVKPQR